MSDAPATDSTSSLYGRETRLALQNFPPHGRLLSDVPELLRSYAWVKAATAKANVDLGVLDALRGNAIVAAAAEMACGGHADQFRLALVQGGGGTSTNMNVNEVLAARATALLIDQGHGDLPVHSNDHVNRSQSSNDSYPTAMALTLAQAAEPALAALTSLERALLGKAAERDELVRLGRTCLQDAVPLTVGETHRAQAQAVRRTADALGATVRELLAVPLGATVIGTRLAAPPGFSEAAVQHLRTISGLDVSVAPDFLDSLAHGDPYSGVANACARVGIVMAKIAADLRMLSATSLLGGSELTLPRLQAGSSIMPGKINPVIPELVMQLSYRIRGAATTVELGASAGELELNVMDSVMLDALLTALGDLAYAADIFSTKCIDGLVWNDEALERNLQGSRHKLVEFAVEVGYDRATLTANNDAAPERPDPRERSTLR